jgi:microcystin-dependent protein
MPARNTSSTSHTHTGVNTVAAGFSGSDVFPFTTAPSLPIGLSANGVGDHAHSADSTTATNQATTATNQATTATNIATTATNIATTATNQVATAVNQNTGGGSAHNNLQPYLVLNYIIKA